jgi:hypothetical protein
MLRTAKIRAIATGEKRFDYFQNTKSCQEFNRLQNWAWEPKSGVLQAGAGVPAQNDVADLVEPRSRPPITRRRCSNSSHYGQVSVDTAGELVGHFKPSVFQAPWVTSNPWAFRFKGGAHDGDAGCLESDRRIVGRAVPWSKKVP